MLSGAIPDALQQVAISKKVGESYIYAFRRFARYRSVPSIPLRLWAFAQHASTIAALAASLWFMAEAGWKLKPGP